MKTTDDVNAPMIALVGIVGALLLFVITVGIQAWFYHYEELEHYKKAVAPPNERLMQLQAKQIEEINGYRLVDAAKPLAAIPIDRAMAIVVKDLETSRTRALGGTQNHAGRNE